VFEDGTRVRSDEVEEGMSTGRAGAAPPNLAPLATEGVPVVEVDAVFRDLFNDQRHRVYSTLLRLTGRQSEAEDLTVETLLLAYRSLTGFDIEQLDTLRPPVWLSAIAVSLWRRHDHDIARVRSGRARFPEGAGTDPAGPRHRVVGPTESGDRGRTLTAALLTLPASQRIAVVLRHLDGLPAAEVAEAMGCPEATARSLVVQGMDRLGPLAPTGNPDRRSGPAPEPAGAGVTAAEITWVPARDDGDRGLRAALAALSVSAPVDLMERIVARWTYVTGPVENAYVAFTGEGISCVVPASPVAGEEEFVAAFARAFGRPLEPADSPPAGVEEALRSGRSTRLRFDLRGRTEFERAVLEATLRIPPGELRPYSWVAAEIRRPRAVRAVGTALGHNPVPLLIPCHRVIRSDGSMGQFGEFGPAMKRRLLEGEGIDVEQVKALVLSGSAYVGDDQTHLVCLPTCHRLPTAGGGHRQGFRLLSEASAAGYVPCPACRPVGR
jgi:O-6-methylguanine DNA methyltransferase/RNA polymerase sigma factor (sigma-70 family)